MAIGPGIIPQSQHTGKAPLNWSREVPLCVKMGKPWVFSDSVFFLNELKNPKLRLL